MTRRFAEQQNQALKNNVRRARSGAKSTKDVKGIIAAGSVAITIGAWGLFAGQDALAQVQAQAPTDQTPTTSSSLTGTGSQSQIVSSLPTIQTLPTVAAQSSTSSSGTGTQTQSQTQQAATTAQPTSAPVPVVAPSTFSQRLAPITSTRSSR